MIVAFLNRIGLLRPATAAGDELAVALWTHDLIEAAGICRRMHETCRTAKE